MDEYSSSCILCLADIDRFLWVACQIDQLSRLTTTAGVNDALRSLPRGLYRTYSRILNGILPESEILASRALRWLAHTVEPLSLDELVEVIAVDENCSTLGDLQKLFVPEDIFQICRSLVRRSEMTGLLSLAHKSVYEFLTAASPHPHPPAPYYIPPVESRIKLAKTCLTYLSFRDFSMTLMQPKVDPDSDDEDTFNISGTGLLLEYPFFDYALRNW